MPIAQTEVVETNPTAGDIKTTKIENLKTAIVNKITSLINTHNSSTTSHSDIRTSISGKADVNHASETQTYGVSSATNYGHPKATSSTPTSVTTSNSSVGTDNGQYARADHSHTINDIDFQEYLGDDIESVVEGMLDDLLIEAQNPYYDFITHDDNNDEIIFYNLDTEQEYKIILSLKGQNNETQDTETSINLVSNVSTYDIVTSSLVSAGNLGSYIKIISCSLIKIGEPNETLFEINRGD